MFDGDRTPVPDALIEIWQAGPDGRYAHPEDIGPVPSDRLFRGFGRACTDAEGRFWFRTVVPGAVEGPDGVRQAPHINVNVFARGLLKQLVTRIYFSDRAAENARDPVLASIGDDAARATLIAEKIAPAGGFTSYRFDIVSARRGRNRVLRDLMELFGALYGTPAMREAFGTRRRLDAMLRFEVGLARAEARCGVIPAPAAEAIAAAADVDRIDIGAVAASAETVGYPVVGLTKQLARLAGEDAGRYVHWGATTQDVLDTATALQMQDGFALLEADLDATVAALAALARRHRGDPMAGRTHLQHALPITFGYACALWLAPLGEHRGRLREARERVRVVQFGGAVGTLASLGTRGREVARALGAELALRVPDAPWHVDRSAFAEAACAIALACGSLAKLADRRRLADADRSRPKRSSRMRPDAAARARCRRSAIRSRASTFSPRRAASTRSSP